MRWRWGCLVYGWGCLVACGQEPTGGSEASGGSSSASGGVFSGGAEGSGGSTATGGAGGSGGTATGGSGSGGDTQSGGGSGFDPCPRDEACKVLPLGDSITFGMGSSGGGYRVALFAAAVKDGKSLTFVGSQANGPSTVEGAPFPRGHDGYSGYTIQQIADMIPDKLAPNPHIVLLHLGTNDMISGPQGPGPQGAPERLGALLDAITEALPDSLLVVSSIIPFPAASSAVATYNAALPGLVEERQDAGTHVLFVDQFAGFPPSELGDGVHPNDAGYARMGGVWYEAIESFLH